MTTRRDNSATRKRFLGKRIIAILVGSRDKSSPDSFEIDSYAQLAHLERNMSFDPAAAAIDRLDAYRLSDLEPLLKMFADDAVIECGCCAMTSLPGKKAAGRYPGAGTGPFPSPFILSGPFRFESGPF